MTDEPTAVSAEDRMIARYFRPLAKHPGALGLIDDAAVLTPQPGQDIVLTADAIVGGVHFFPDDPADMVGKKALRVNLSDLAAKGAAPAGFLLALALPETSDEAWIERFADGLGADAHTYGCPLLGGDSVRTPGPAMISITALGTVPQGSMVTRSGARAGDRIMVTGSIGDAALGLALRKAEGRTNAVAAQGSKAGRANPALSFAAAAQRSRRGGAAARFSGDGRVRRPGRRSRQAPARIRRHRGDSDRSRALVRCRKALMLNADPAQIETVLTGGDDYEIVCTIAPDTLASFQSAATAAGVPVTEIGRVMVEQQPARFLDRDGKPRLFKQTSFSHF